MFSLLKMVRSNSSCSNSIVPEFSDCANTELDPSTAPIFGKTEEIFNELERWHDVLKPHADELRGPHP